LRPNRSLEKGDKMASIVIKNIKGKDYFYIQTYEKDASDNLKQKTFYGGSTRTKAEIKLKKYELSRLEGTPYDPTPTTQKAKPKRAKEISNNTGGNEQLFELTENFLTSKKQDISPKTLDLYRICLENFKKYLGKDVKLKEITIAVLEDFKLSKASMSYWCRKNHFTTLKSFFSWLNHLEIYDKHPAKKIHIKKPIKNKPPEFLSQAEINKMLAYAEADHREYVILHFLLNTGLRRSEICGVIWDDIDLENNTLKVFGKGAKFRHVPLNSKTLELIHTLPKNKEYVFQTQIGTQLNHEALRTIFIKYTKLMGRKLHPHLMRHTFATHLLAACGNPVTVKEILGHADLKTTMIYAHVNQSMLQQAIQKIYLE